MSGSIKSEAIEFIDGAGPKFERSFGLILTWGKLCSIKLSTKTKLVTGAIPDGTTKNSTGAATGPIDLSNVDVDLRNNSSSGKSLMFCGSCPTLQDWTLEWLRE